MQSNSHPAPNQRPSLFDRAELQRKRAELEAMLPDISDLRTRRLMLEQLDALGDLLEVYAE